MRVDPSTERLTREDAARWHMATRENPMVIGGLLLFDAPIAIETLEAVVHARLVPHARFRQHVVEPGRWFARPRWRDDQGFDVREHVRALPMAPVERGDLGRLVSERMNAALPRDRSPWALELVDVASGGSALIVRFQHCLADGRALVTLLEELADGPGSESVPPAARHEPENARRAGLRAGLAGAARFFARSLAPRAPRWPRPRRALSGRKQVAWSAELPMDRVKAIAHGRGHHVADVLLAAVAGALERAHAGGRRPRTIQSLFPVAAPSPTGGLGNHFASVFVRLPLSRVGAQARLELVAREMAAVRGGGALRSALTLMRLAGAAAPALERWAIRWWARRAALVVSSLAGPPSPVRLAGERLASTVVWAPAPASIGVSLTFFGYAGRLHVGVLTDEALGVSPEHLVTCFHEALDELDRAAPALTP
jgi:WS/DGAT/MGAT family acyltransferase